MSLVLHRYVSRSLCALKEAVGIAGMNVWKIRSEDKTALEFGRWETGKMSRSAFPMSKARAKAYRLGSAWTWRVIKFDADGSQYRILVAYRTDKEQFMATLAVEDAGDMRIVASLEYHPTHGGWHIHYASEPMVNVPSGVRRGPWVRRMECVKHEQFGLTGSSAGTRAMTIITDVYGLKRANGQGPML